MFHCSVGVWVIEQHAIILSATVRSPTVVLFSHKAGVKAHNKMQSYWMQLINHNNARMGADGLVIFGAMLSATVMITQACTFLGQATSSLQHFFWWLKMTLQCEK